MLRSFFIALVMALVALKVDAIEPYFGYSGTYRGELQYQGSRVEAQLQIIHREDIIRGFINTKIKFVDESGQQWEGTTLFLKGKVLKDGRVSLKFTDHQCAAVAKICSIERKLSGKAIVAEIQEDQIGPDYVLYKTTLDAGGSTEIPFSSATFKMDSTFAASPPIEEGPFYGVWDLIGYGSDYLVYPTASPVFDMNLTVFNLKGRDKTNVFMYSGGHWYPANHFLGLISSVPGQHALTLGWLWWKYELEFSKGYAFGFIRHPNQVGAELDFEGLLWGFYDFHTSNTHRLVRPFGQQSPNGKMKGN